MKEGGTVRGAGVKLPVAPTVISSSLNAGPWEYLPSESDTLINRPPTPPWIFQKTRDASSSRLGRGRALPTPLFPFFPLWLLVGRCDADSLIGSLNYYSSAITMGGHWSSDESSVAWSRDWSFRGIGLQVWTNITCVEDAEIEILFGNGVPY